MQYLAVVPRQDKSYPRQNLMHIVIGGTVIFGMIVPLVLIDLSFRIYHAIYFRLNAIPLVPRKSFIAIDRGSLAKLNWMQRINCAYCDYANGLVAWITVVVKMTEIYSCAIRHPRPHPMEQYQEEYYPSEMFE